MRLRLPWRWRRPLPAVPFREGVGRLCVGGEAWTDRAAFLAECHGSGQARFAAQWQIGQQLPAACGDAGLAAHCPLCGRSSRFATPGDPATFGLREGLACEGCRVNARARHALALLVEGFDPATARIDLTEQASPAFVWLQRHVVHARGSEFGLDATRRRRLQGWFEHLGGRGALREADVTALADADGSIDAIGCFDVLEHVPDYRAALREFARVLVPGGRLVLTVPFLETEATTLVRARLRRDGSVEHHLPPEIHGDPVAGGVLCYYHFGWDLLDAVREAGFRHAEWMRSFAPEFALYGLWALRAER